MNTSLKAQFYCIILLETGEEFEVDECRKFDLVPAVQKNHKSSATENCTCKEGD